MPDYGYFDNQSPWPDTYPNTTKIIIQNGVTTIGSYTFSGLKKLTSVELPDGLLSIGENAFDGCTMLTNINFPNSLKSIGDHAFQECSSLSEIDTGTGLTSIGVYAFDECTGLTEVIFGDNLTTIGENAFYWCPNLSRVKMGKNVASIGNNAFYRCETLSSILIPAKTVGDSAFYGCGNLERVFITDNLKSINDYAFDNTGIKEVYYKGSTTEWGKITFGQDNNKIQAVTEFDFDPYIVHSVTLDKKDFILGKGNKASLTAIVFPETADDQTVTWTNEDDTVLKLTDNGTKASLEGLALGESTVTVKTNDQGKTAKVKVTVGVPVTGVTLSENKLNVGIGKTRALSWTIEPEDASNKNVTFESSDETKVTVDKDGVITGVDAGKATITIRTEDGGKEDSCEVTVVDDIPVESVALSEEELILVPEETASLSCKVLPEDATNKDITWSVADSSIATVEDGTVTAVAEGETTVTATADDNGKKASCRVKVWKGSIDLTKASGIIAKNETLELAVKIPEGITFDSITWRVSDNSIAEISDTGVVTGKGVGTTSAVATASLKGKTYEAACSLRVWAGSISLTKDSAVIKKGDTLTLSVNKVEGIEFESITWKVSDNSIADIDSNGLFTGKALGTVDAVATAVFNGKSYEARCAVTIERRHYGEDETDKAIKQAIAGAKMDISKILNPNGAISGKVRYASTDKKKASVNKKGIVTPKNPGEVKISIEQKSGSGWSSVSSCDINVDKPVMEKKITATAGQKGLNAFDFLSGTEYAPTEWQSTNTGVATIDPKTGDITVIKKGSTKIIAVYGTGKDSSKKKYKTNLKVTG